MTVCAYLGCFEPVLAVYKNGDALCITHAHQRGSVGLAYPPVLPPLPAPRPVVPVCSSSVCLVSGCNGAHEERGCCEVHAVVLRNAPSPVATDVLLDPATRLRLAPFWPNLLDADGQFKPSAQERTKEPPEPAEPAFVDERPSLSARRPRPRGTPGERLEAMAAEARARHAAKSAAPAPPPSTTPFEIPAPTPEETSMPVRPCPAHPDRPQARYGLCGACVASVAAAVQRHARQGSIPASGTALWIALHALDLDAATAAGWSRSEGVARIRRALQSQEQPAPQPAAQAASAADAPQAPQPVLSEVQHTEDPPGELEDGHLIAPLEDRDTPNHAEVDAEDHAEVDAEATRKPDGGGVEVSAGLEGAAPESAELVCGVLGLVMASPPPESVVEAWTEEEREAALDWATVAQVDGETPEPPLCLLPWFPDEDADGEDALSQGLRSPAPGPRLDRPLFLLPPMDRLRALESQAAALREALQRLEWLRILAESEAVLEAELPEDPADLFGDVPHPLRSALLACIDPQKWGVVVRNAVELAHRTLDEHRLDQMDPDRDAVVDQGAA